MFQNLNKKLIYFIVAVFVIFSAIVLALYFLQGPREQIPPVSTEPSPKIFTPEEIQAALAKKADQPPAKPLTQEEINQALGKKALGEGNKPLTQEEIQKALNAQR